MPDDATEGVAENSFLGCNHQSTCMPQLQPLCSALWYPTYYPEETKARVSPVVIINNWVASVQPAVEEPNLSL